MATSRYFTPISILLHSTRYRGGVWEFKFGTPRLERQANKAEIVAQRIDSEAADKRNGNLTDNASNKESESSQLGESMLARNTMRLLSKRR